MKISKKVFDVVFEGLAILLMVEIILQILNVCYFRTQAMEIIISCLGAISIMLPGIIACQSWLSRWGNPILFLMVRGNHILVLMGAMFYVWGLYIMAVEVGYFRVLLSIPFVILGILFAWQRHKTEKTEKEEDEIVNGLGVD